MTTDIYQHLVEDQLDHVAQYKSMIQFMVCIYMRSFTYILQIY